MSVSDCRKGRIIFSCAVVTSWRRGKLNLFVIMRILLNSFGTGQVMSKGVVAENINCLMTTEGTNLVGL